MTLPSPLSQDLEPSFGFTTDLQKLELMLEEKIAAHSPTHGLRPTVTIGELENLLEGRGLVTMTLIFALPFVQPIPIPGLSILFGAVIFALGLKVAFGTHGKLPEFVRRKALEPATVQKMARGGRKVFSRLEKLFRKRLSPLVFPPGSQGAGLSLMLCGVAMALPLPPVIIFSNSLPALAVIFICLGMIERDGLFVVAGHLVALGTWIYFGFWWEIIWLAISHIPDLLRDYGVPGADFIRNLPWPTPQDIRDGINP